MSQIFFCNTNGVLSDIVPVYTYPTVSSLIFKFQLRFNGTRNIIGASVTFEMSRSVDNLATRVYTRCLVLIPVIFRGICPLKIVGFVVVQT